MSIIRQFAPPVLLIEKNCMIRGAPYMIPKSCDKCDHAFRPNTASGFYGDVKEMFGICPCCVTPDHMDMLSEMRSDKSHKIDGMLIHARNRCYKWNVQLHPKKPRKRNGHDVMKKSKNLQKILEKPL